MVVATQIKVGMIIIFKNELYRVVDVIHITPGNWRGMVQTKLKNLKTGVTIENRFRSEDKVEKANFEQKDMEYLYDNDSDYIFMDRETYEQFSIASDIIGENIHYLIPNIITKVSLFEGKPVEIEFPLTIELKVVSTEPYLKGATASTSSKPATLETGLVVHVPKFIENGNIVKIDTSEGKYLERVK